MKKQNKISFQKLSLTGTILYRESVSHATFANQASQCTVHSIFIELEFAMFQQPFSTTGFHIE